MGSHGDKAPTTPPDAMPERVGFGKPEVRDPRFAELDALIEAERRARIPDPSGKNQPRRRPLSPALPCEQRQQVEGSGEAGDRLGGSVEPRRRVVVHARRPARRTILHGADRSADVRWFLKKLMQKYPRWTKADKSCVLALIQRDLPPYPNPVGRPRREDVTKALRWETEGVPRKNIYRRLGKITCDQQHALREAMRQRKFRMRRRDKSATVTPTNPTPVCTV
jgi:hypothetical protein